MTSSSTCLLLGAGASHASVHALPTMSSFFRQTDLTTRQDLDRFLQAFYPGRPVEEYNLEEVLAFLDIARSRVGAWGLAPYDDQQLMDRLYRDVVSYASERLALPENAACPIHRKLFEGLSPQDTVVTVNYDLIADSSLRGLSVLPPPDGGNNSDRVSKLKFLLGNYSTYGGGTPPSLSSDEQTGGYYLKLHGSLGWLTCLNPACHNSNYISTGDESGGSTQEAGQPCRFCGASLAEFIVPPVATKRVNDRGRLALLWNLALRAFIRASRIGIVGVSFAPSDFELGWLLREALVLRPRTKLRVDLVDVSSVVRQRIRNLLPRFDGEVREYDHLQSYVDSFPA